MQGFDQGEVIQSFPRSRLLSILENLQEKVKGTTPSCLVIRQLPQDLMDRRAFLKKLNIVIVLDG